VVEAGLDEGYPRVVVALQACPDGAEAYVNGVPLGPVPYAAHWNGTSCLVEVDASGVSMLKLDPGDNLTLVFYAGGGAATVVLAVEGGEASAGASPEAVVGEAELQDITEASREVLGSAEGRGLDSPGRGAWLAAALALAAAAAAVGVREYGR